MSLEQRQRQTMEDFNRSSFRHEPPGFSREARRLDEIAAANERHRQEQAQAARVEADLIAHAKQGEFRETYTRRNAEDIHD
jgi:hypothetical protein